MSDAALEALRKGLAEDDEAIVQGAMTIPPPLQLVSDWPVESCEAIAYAAWKGDGLQTVGEVEEAWAKACFDADQRLGEPAACRWFLNAYDDWSRDEMRANLLAEVEAELAKRAGQK